MKIVDANIILRYLLNDTEDLSAKAADLLENNEVMVPNEVIAEIVYVLEKVYKIKSVFPFKENFAHSYDNYFFHTFLSITPFNFFTHSLIFPAAYNASLSVVSLEKLILNAPSRTFAPYPQFFKTLL